MFPFYSEVRLLLPIWDGVERSQITGLRSTLKTLYGEKLVDLLIEHQIGVRKKSQLRYLYPGRELFPEIVLP
jgi:hypothetical protein